MDQMGEWAPAHEDVRPVFVVVVVYSEDTLFVFKRTVVIKRIRVVVVVVFVVVAAVAVAIQPVTGNVYGVDVVYGDSGCARDLRRRGLRSGRVLGDGAAASSSAS